MGLPSAARVRAFSFAACTSLVLVLAACGEDEPEIVAAPDVVAEPDAGEVAAVEETPVDAGPPPAVVDATPPPEPCGALEGTTRLTCSADGRSRAKCVSHEKVSETCTRGCFKKDAPDEDVCMGTTSPWSCTGTYGTTRAEDGDYFITAFGCWVDASGVKHGDSGDNCIPGCFADIKAAGLCDKTSTGKACEEKLTWFIADAARFGCNARVRVENPANGKAVIAIAIDQGPACSVERRVSKAVLDASGRVNRELFGVDHGVIDKALVHVVEVDPATPLGPVK